MLENVHQMADTIIYLTHPTCSFVLILKQCMLGQQTACILLYLHGSKPVAQRIISVERKFRHRK